VLILIRPIAAADRTGLRIISDQQKGPARREPAGPLEIKSGDYDGASLAEHPPQRYRVSEG